MALTSDVDVARDQERETLPDCWKQLHVGGVDGIGCQFSRCCFRSDCRSTGIGRKTEGKTTGKAAKKFPRRGPTASTDTKMAFDVARPKHIGTILGEQNTDGWITAALHQRC